MQVTKTYKGNRAGDTRRVTVEMNNGAGKGVWYGLDPKASQLVWNHSPDGFNWGYGGSGPAQLALGILLDWFLGQHVPRRKAEAQAINLHQRFKFAFVAAMGDAWVLDGQTIETWIRDQEERQQ